MLQDYMLGQEQRWLATILVPFASWFLLLGESICFELDVEHACGVADCE